MNVATIGTLAIGETFQFGTVQPLKIGAVINLTRQYGGRYGIAKITKDLGKGFYEAKRVI